MMAKEVVSIASEFDIGEIIMLGDIKDSIMHPERGELMSIKGFFNALEGYKIRIVRGNHDAFISEITGIEPVDELLIGRFALLHGEQVAYGACHAEKLHNDSAQPHIGVVQGQARRILPIQGTG
jgi:Predicted ICC-like phosphoesterases